MKTSLRGAVCVAIAGLAAISLLGVITPATAQAPEQRKIIIFVWDGLRPDSVNPADTPNLHALREAGVEFTDNHSTYPTFTMMNAASFATGGQLDPHECLRKHELARMQDEGLVVADRLHLGQIGLRLANVDERVAAVAVDAEVAIQVQVHR